MVMHTRSSFKQHRSHTETSHDQRIAIQTLYNAGYRPSEIYKTLKTPTYSTMA